MRDFTPRPSPGQGQAVPGLVCIRCARSQRKARGGKKCLLPTCQKRSHLLGWEKGAKEASREGQERGQPPPSAGSSGNPDPPPPASLPGEQRGPPQVVIKNASSRPPTCPAIRPTKVGETSLRMMPPKDKTLSQACFHFRVPTGDRAEKGLQPSDKWEQRPPSSGAMAQSQGRAGPQSSAFLTAHPTDKRC